MLPSTADRPKLVTVLTQLGSAIEELLLSGLTTASIATRQTLTAALQESARFGLMRLGSTLRTANEELGRFMSGDSSFSRKRLTFFLSRAWLLSRGLTHALHTEDEAQYDRLIWSPSRQPLPKIEVVCIGVSKRVAAGAFVAFDFRFRAVTESLPVLAGQSVAWSCVFPLKAGLELLPEGFLHLPQKQKFAPLVLLEKKSVVIERANIISDGSGVRLSLTEQSSVLQGNSFSDWSGYLEWSTEHALERIRQHRPGPLDLDTELQEEIVLHEYEIGPPEEGDSPGQIVYPISSGALTFAAMVSSNLDGQCLREQLDRLRTLQKKRPPLYGLMHYERCRLVLQVLTAFRPEPDHLMISKDNISKAALLKAMSFN